MGKKRCGDEDDLIQNILVRLPVVSLLRFKSVCKSWRHLIKTSFFIDLHSTNTFNSSSSNKKFGSFILQAAVDCERFWENAILMLSSPVSESESECVSGSGSCGSLCTTVYYGIDDQQQQLVLKLGNLGFPSCYQFDKKIIKPPIVIGSCNGLICLYDEQPNQVSLWNPATRQFRILPKPSSSITNAAGNGNGGNVHRLFAFGFDDETKDYKVVLLSVFNRRMLDYEIVGPVAMKCICRVQVYSLSTNSWKLLQGITCLPGSPFPYPPDSSSELFYLNGCCFFMAKLLYSEQCTPPPPKTQDRFIISLDLTKETITPIQLPDHHYHEHLYLCYFGMKIALFTKFVHTKIYDVNDHSTGSWEDFQIWVFNEPRSSSVDWAYLSHFKIKKLGLPGERNIIPRGISNDGVFALLETEIHDGLGNKKKRKMKLYNLVTNEMKMNFLSCDQVLSKAYAYKPSLVSIIGEAAEADDMVIGKAAAAEMN